MHCALMTICQFSNKIEIPEVRVCLQFCILDIYFLSMFTNIFALFFSLNNHEEKTLARQIVENTTWLLYFHKEKDSMHYKYENITKSNDPPARRIFLTFLNLKVVNILCKKHEMPYNYTESLTTPVLARIYQRNCAIIKYMKLTVVCVYIFQLTCINAMILLWVHGLITDNFGSLTLLPPLAPGLVVHFVYNYTSMIIMICSKWTSLAVQMISIWMKNNS